MAQTGVQLQTVLQIIIHIHGQCQIRHLHSVWLRFMIIIIQPLPIRAMQCLPSTKHLHPLLLQARMAVKHGCTQTHNTFTGTVSV